MKPSDIADNAGSRKKRMRVGRGIGSGKGKTAGRGGQGQTARSGVRITGLEGGQMPLHRRVPQLSFTYLLTPASSVIHRAPPPNAVANTPAATTGADPRPSAAPPGAPGRDHCPRRRGDLESFRAAQRGRRTGLLCQLPGVRAGPRGLLSSAGAGSVRDGDGPS